MSEIMILQSMPSIDIVWWILLLALAIVGLIIGISLSFKWIRRYGAYSYATARVSAMKSTLFRRENLTSLLQVEGLSNLMGKFLKSPYSPYVEELEEVNPVNLEYAFHDHLIDTYNKVIQFAPDEMCDILKEISKKFDVWNIKAILAFKFAGIQPKDIKEIIYLQGQIPQEVYERMIESEDIKDAITMLEGTEYWPSISKVLPEFEEHDSLLPIENALEVHYWGGVWGKLSITEVKYSEVVREAIGTEIDIYNIKLLLRCIIEKVPSEEMKNYLIPIHYHLDNQKIERMISAETIEGIINSLEETPYIDCLRKEFDKYQETGSLYTLEKSLYEFLLSKIRGISIQHYIGIGPLLAFIYEKEMEVKNLIMIINGKSEEIEPEKLKMKLINP